MKLASLLIFSLAFIPAGTISASEITFRTVEEVIPPPPELLEPGSLKTVPVRRTVLKPVISVDETLYRGQSTTRSGADDWDPPPPPRGTVDPRLIQQVLITEQQTPSTETNSGNVSDPITPGPGAAETSGNNIDKRLEEIQKNFEELQKNLNERLQKEEDDKKTALLDPGSEDHNKPNEKEDRPRESKWTVAALALLSIGMTGAFLITFSMAIYFRTRWLSSLVSQNNRIIGGFDLDSSDYMLESDGYLAESGMSLNYRF